MTAPEDENLAIKILRLRDEFIQLNNTTRLLYFLAFVEIFIAVATLTLVFLFGAGR